MVGLFLVKVEYFDGEVIFVFGNEVFCVVCYEGFSINLWINIVLIDSVKW